MSLMYNFGCGCKIPVFNEILKPNDGLPSMEILYEEMARQINYIQGCSGTWELMSEGRTKGVFQLETQLGQGWAGKLKPTSLEEIAALVSLIRPGCISKNTKITLKIYNDRKKGGGIYKKQTIGDLYKKFHGKNHNRKNYIVSVCEETNSFVENKIVDVMYNGKKDVYRPVFKTRKKNCHKISSVFFNLECTLDHKLLTHDRGWVELQHINIDERVAVFINTKTKSKHKNNAEGEKNFGDICFRYYKYDCIFCDWKEASLYVNHLEGNRKTNNLPENLCFMCPNHHRMYSDGIITKKECILAREKYKLSVSDDIMWVQYKEKEYVGNIDVYDISVDGPNHNFIAGNVVVHNCLRAMVDGKDGKQKSMTQLYVDRKHGVEEIKYFHDALEPILKDTRGILCIHEDTYVSMADGTERKIKDIISGCNTMSMCRDYHISVDMCSNIKKSPNTTGVEIILENGYRIKLTRDHKVYTSNGEKKVKDLNIDTDVIQIVTKQFHLDTYNSDYYGLTPYIIGQLIGDGCSGECIASGEQNNHNKLFNYLNANLSDKLNFREYYHCRSNYIAISGKELLNDKNFGNRKTKYRYAIEQLGLHKTKNNKIIPPEIFMSEPKKIAEFLAGLFDADGHAGVSSNGITAACHYCTTNKEVINGIRKLLSILGIQTYITVDETHIYVNNIKLFKKVVGKYLIVKEIVGKLTEADTYGSFPKRLLKERAYSLGYTNIKAFAIDNNISSGCIIGKGFINQKTAVKAGFKFEDTSFMKIKSINKLKNKAKFYSISIKDNHNLIGNGIVISNCYQEQAMRIAVDLAGFDETQADVLRKSIGKKLPELMAQVKGEFLEGCEKEEIVNKSEAEQIFAWIQESQRYSFNKCLSPFSILELKNGVKVFLRDVEKGHFVKTPDGYAEVLDVIDQGEQHLFLVSLGLLYGIECTLTHKFLCENNEIFPLWYILDKGLAILCENGPETISSIEYMGLSSSMDIEIDSETHIFFADGIATSNSHGIGYGVLGYLSMFTKFHFPLHFYCSWLKFARNKQDTLQEMKELVADAKMSDVLILPPSVDNIFLNHSDVCVNDDHVNFGIRCIKKIGDASVKKFLARIRLIEDQLGKTIDKWSWLEFLSNVGAKVNKTTVNNLISVGTFGKYGISRTQMLYDYEAYGKLTIKETDNVCRLVNTGRFENLTSVLEYFVTLEKKDGGVSTAPRREKIHSIIKLLKEPPFSMADKPSWILKQEKSLIGTPISYSAIDTVDIKINTNTTCKQFKEGKSGNELTVAVELTSVREWTVKSGKNKGAVMAFATAEDNTGSIDCVIFSEGFHLYEHLLTDNNVVVLSGERSSKGSFQINKIFQI